MGVFEGLFKRKIEKNSVSTGKKTAPITIKSDQKADLPKVSIKSVLSAIQNEELNDLIPLYAVFLKRDLHLGSEMRKRRRQILSVSLMVESEDKELEKLIKGYLKAIDLYKLTFDVSLAIPYGFVAINMVYDNIRIGQHNYFAPKTFIAIHPRYTDYDKKERKLYIKLTSGNKIEPQEHPEQFLWHEHPEDTGELVDYGVMSNVLLTSVMKHAVMNSNMQYFEMLGVPPVYINADVQDEGEARDLVEQVMSLHSNSVGVFPKETAVNLLLGQAGRTEFLAFIQYCDQQISHNIMGNVLSGNATPNGTQALGTVHDGRRVDVLTYDCCMIERTIKVLVERFLAMNYPKESPEYELYYDNGDSKDEMRLAQVYATLSGAGYKIPVKHIEETFNIAGIEYINPSQADNSGNLGNYSFEENSAKRAQNLTKAAENLSTKEAEDEIYSEMTRIFKNAKTYQEALDTLLEEYPKLDFDKAVDTLEKVVANTYIAERAE